MPHLGNIVAGEPLTQPELPLVHTTRCEFLESFVASKRIEPRPCSRFGDDLIYFFYGRPAYRSALGSKPGEPIELCPLCFVLKPGVHPPITVKRVFPCDTGAIREGVFQPELEWNHCNELALAAKIESARQFVSLSFGNNRGYFFGELSPRVAPEAGSVFERYCALVRKAPTERADDRRSAIEIQVGDQVSLVGHLLFVVLPREFFQEARIVTAIRDEWKCDVVAYPTFKGDAPAEFYSVVRDRVTQWFEKEGFI